LPDEQKNEMIIDVLGSKMIVNLVDKGISRDLYYNGIREPESTEILEKELENVDGHILEIGANIGYYVLIEAKNPNIKKIIAIEPDPRNFKMLERQVELNQLNGRVELHNVAIGDQNGDIRFLMSESSNLSKVSSDDKTGIIIPVTTVDTLVQDKPISLLRFDVEGFEYNILKGAKNTLQNNNLKIFMEVHPPLIKNFGVNIDDMWELLSSLGYKIKYFITYRNPELKLTRRGILRGEVERMDIYLSDALKNPELKKRLDRTNGYHLFLEK
jgi:FkbM family methyltransferase